MVITIKDALNTLGISAYCKDNDYDTIVWTNPEESVSKKDLESRVAELQKAEDAVQFQRDREIAYPKITDVVVALAEKEEGDDTMWKQITTLRQKVKSDNPKPT
ncbi:hypothetical protein [uncultured Mediterranean phage uvMED]|nr:hypothetical protein [uncultured Mediterranean phage uvMED]